MLRERLWNVGPLKSGCAANLSIIAKITNRKLLIYDSFEGLPESVEEDREVKNYTKGDFSGSVSGGCVESAVVRECVGIIKEKKPFKKIEFKVSNESAWEVGLACGGEIAVCLEQIN